MGKKQGYWGIYGSVRIPRVYCEECKGMTLVIDGIKQCCEDAAKDTSTSRYKYMVQPNRKRRKPHFKERQRILQIQDRKCLYCNHEFGSLYMRNNKILQTKLHFDHLIPFTYSQTNKGTFVAACNICNGIKSSKMFNTVEEVYYYVKYNREKKGIKFLDDIENLPTVSQAI